MAKAKGFSASWYHSRFIIGLVLVLISLFLFYLSKNQNYLFLFLSLGTGILAGLCSVLYYRNRPHLQKELPVSHKIIVGLAFLGIILTGIQDQPILEILMYSLAFLGIWVGTWGFLGKRYI